MLETFNSYNFKNKKNIYVKKRLCKFVLSCTWKDQGKGNMKGQILFKISRNNTIIDEIIFKKIAPHYYEKEIFAIPIEILKKILPGDIIQIFVKAGEGGGHKLFLMDQKIEVDNKIDPISFLNNNTINNEYITDNDKDNENNKSIQITDEWNEKNNIKKIGNIDVNNIEDVLYDLKNNNNCIVSNGISILLRIKNEESTIKNAIISIVDLVDEIIVVNNMSTDKTEEIIKDLESKYKNIYCYNYNISIPKVGIDHINSLKNGSNNTIGTYYNWCLSKATRRYCVKWDGDFIGLRNNFKKMIDIYDLKNRTDKLSIWFTGASLYYNKYINLSSWYEEFRIITKTKNAKWQNYKGCETIFNYVLSSEKLYIFPFKENVKNNSADILEAFKKESPIVFFENKNLKDFKYINSILDKRDDMDNYFIKKYKDDNNNNNNNNKNIIDINILIIIPSLVAGGGNYWAKLLVEHFKYLGWNSTICVLNINSNNKFYDFDDIDVINYSNNLNYDKYSYILTTVTLNFDTNKIKHKLYGFSHSDVSYVNRNFLYKFNNVICLNETTKNKFIQQGFNKNLYILNNSMKINKNVNNVRFNKNSIKILFCNRITFDKNIIMALFAIKNISVKFNITLTLLAGGSEYSSSEYQMLISTIKFLGISDIVKVLETQKNVADFYNSHDFCFLLSVSEGCSYGILESINHEIPFIYTDITPNNEIIEKMLPCVNFIGNQKLLDNNFCINNYNDFIVNLGYIHKNELKENGLLEYGKYNQLFYEPNQLSSLIKYENSSNSLNKFIEKKKEIFNKNVSLIEIAFIDMINYYDNYKNNVINLKQKISKIYFSDINIRKQIIDIFTTFKGVSYDH